MVDTGHCRPVGFHSVDQLPSPGSAQRRTSDQGRHRAASRRSGPADGGEVCDNGGDTTAEYVLEVKRALATEPDVYRRFVDVVRRYHDQRRLDHDFEQPGNAIAYSMSSM